ncbi:MAG: hypothetical protein AB1413_07790 [Thermodesulfobacteriota bacterium]
MPSPNPAPAAFLPRAARKEPFPAAVPAAHPDTAAPDSIHYPSFMPRREMYVLHREFGRIVEIGMGGLRFTYFAQEFFALAPPAEGLLFSNSDDFLEEIPFVVLADRTLSLPFASKYLLRERRVRFGELTASQTRRLERFILKNAHIPQLSHDSRYADFRSLAAMHS